MLKFELIQTDKYFNKPFATTEKSLIYQSHKSYSNSLATSIKNAVNKNYNLKIKTKRLLLRKLKQSDWEVISYLRSNHDVNKFVKRPSAETKEKALEFISKISNGTKKKNFYYWCVSEKRNIEMIGSVCLWNFSKDKKSGRNWI